MRYLGAEEKERCRDLWREAFFEDSESFVDYYFKEKMKDSRVLVQEEDGRIVSMLHRNPYEIYMRGHICRCDYIVGVATAVAERNKGHMRMLLLAALRDMCGEKMPFAFLMPAREALYRPYDFRYVFDQPRWVLQYAPKLRQTPFSDHALLKDLAEWQNAWLKRQYEVFALRSEAYLEQIEKELASEDGSVSLIYHDEEFIGMSSEWGLKEREQRFLYIGEKYRAQVAKKPAIMARILCLPEFVRTVRLSGESSKTELTIELGVSDLFVSANQGVWSWRLNKSGSEMVRESRMIAKGRVPAVPIADLTQWLFGYEVSDAVKQIPHWDEIEPFRGVFLDEVV